MSDDRDRIHRWIDGEDGAGQEPGGEELREYAEVMEQLAGLRAAAPPDLADRVMAALPPEPDRPWLDRLRALWPSRGRWLAPALAGALAALVLVAGIGRLRGTDDRIAVTFEVRAPTAQRVELVGSFNDWRPGEIVLKGPDATGHWTATVKLPPGRHEYVFLVDGREWLTDPRAVAHRPDGFGRENAVIEL